MYQPRPFQVMTKPIGPLCNLKCTYCYYLDKQKFFPENNQFQMSEKVVETFIRDYITCQSRFRTDEIWFSWQGGEPTLLGIDYFRRIVELQKKYCPEAKTICNAFQTNGTLLNDEWASFFHKNKFLVGLSIDGPKNLHDHYRTDHSGRPTFDRVVNGLKALAGPPTIFVHCLIVASGQFIPGNNPAPFYPSVLRTQLAAKRKMESFRKHLRRKGKSKFLPLIWQVKFTDEFLKST